MWLYSNDFSNNHKKSLKVQDFTNFRYVSGFGSQYSKIHITGQFFSWYDTFSRVLFGYLHLYNLHWKVCFLYFSTFPGFLRRIPNSSTFEELPENIALKYFALNQLYSFLWLNKLMNLEFVVRRKGI